MRFIVATIMLLASLVPPSAFGFWNDPGPQAQDLAKQANELLDKGDSLHREDKIEEAARAFLEAAALYEKALALKPDDKSYLQNLMYSLGRPGYVRIQKADKLMKEKHAAEAAALYEAAIADYESALKKYPGEKNFQQNRQYAKRNGGVARFQNLLETGGPAPAFDLPSVKEGKLSLSQWSDRVILIEFMAGWCPSCRESLPLLQEIQNRYAGKPVQVVLLALDYVESWKKSGSDKSTIELTRNLTIPAAWADENIFFAYGAFPSIPAVVLIGKNGRLVRRVEYEDRTKEKLIEFIDAALK